MRIARLVLSLGLLACTPTTVATSVTGEGDVRGAAGTAAELVAAVNRGDYEAAATLTVAEQMPWLVMAEGASLAQAAVLGPADLQMVAANYWRGFAQSAQLPEVGAGTVEETVIEGTRFAEVPLEGRLRLVLRQQGSWRVDLIASFAATLSNRLLQAAQVVEANRGEQGDGLRAMLAQQRPSVEMAVLQPGLPDPTLRDLEEILDLLADLAG